MMQQSWPSLLVWPVFLDVDWQRYRYRWLAPRHRYRLRIQLDTVLPRLVDAGRIFLEWLLQNVAAVARTLLGGCPRDIPRRTHFLQRRPQERQLPLQVGQGCQLQEWRKEAEDSSSVVVP